MKTLHRVLIGFVIIIAMSSNAMAADYLVSGSGSAEINGTYVDSGRTYTGYGGQSGAVYEYYNTNNGVVYLLGRRD